MTRAAHGSGTVRAGAAVCLALAALWALDAGGARGFLREKALDLALAPADPGPVVVIDIDSESLRRHGAWPWSRLQLARLVNAAADAEPLVIGLDLLLAGDDRFSPAAVARGLARETGRADLAAIAGELADGDAELARALGRSPTVLGVVLSPEAGPPLADTAPILVRATPDLRDIWASRSAMGPGPALAGAAAGLGLVVFENDPDGVARRVPLLALAAGAPVAGFAVEVARLAREASTLMIDAAPPRLMIGDIAAPLGPDATLRPRASSPPAMAARTISATRVLDGAAADALRGAIVLIGSGAPEVGVLRRTARSEAAPAVQIEADAVATLLRGDIAWRPGFLGHAETAAALLLGLIAWFASARLRPARGALVALALATGWAALALALQRASHWLADPAGPAALAGLVFAIGALTSAVGLERRERQLRARFEQHLAPAVVARILEDPDAVRLEGETREVTALFTDIEGFTPMTERAEPRALVALLDAYFQELVDIVVAHGGMVDKIVGDAIHALFNAPLDLPDHPRRALECALAIREASRLFRERPEAVALGLGRTRVGLETGPAIVGDVGGRRKLDYTAHGTAINTAARLEAANKELGTSICVGPVAAARLPAGAVRSLGLLTLRGREGLVEAFEPT